MPAENKPKKAVLQENAIILEILSTVERDNRTTQRKLSRELDIALGLTNAYVKRCVKKGYIKIRQVPLNRYAYYLTPKGFGEKSRLTAEYLAVSFNFFRDARAQCAALFERCAANGLHTLALAGVSELAEIAVLSASDTNTNIICIIDERSNKARWASRPVVADLKRAQTLAMDGLHGVVITDVLAPQAAYEVIREAARKHGLPDRNVLAPTLLRISDQPMFPDRGDSE